MKLIVMYDGQPQTEIDDSLVKSLKTLGFDFVGSGYALSEQTRDLEFKRGGTDDGRKK